MVIEYTESITGIKMRMEGEAYPLALQIERMGLYIPRTAMGELRARLVKRTEVKPVMLDSTEVILSHTGVIALHYTEDDEVGIQTLEDSTALCTIYKEELDGV